MSVSDDNDIWSESSDSFSITESSSLHCPTPRRLVDLIADKLKSMKCATNGGQTLPQAEEMVDQEAISYKDSDEYSSDSEDPNMLAIMLNKRQERLNSTRDSEGNLREPSLRKVKFLDTEAPGSSRNVSASKQITVDVLTGAEMDLDLPSASVVEDCMVQNTGKEVKLDKGPLEHLLLQSAQSIFILNFPDLTELVESITKREVGQNGNEKPIQRENTDEELNMCTTADKGAEANTEENAARLLNNGQLRMYKSGRVTISFGDKVFEMAKESIPIEQEVVCVEVDEARQTSTMHSLGVAEHYFDVVPQMEDIDDTNEIDDKLEGMANDTKEKDEIVKDDTQYEIKNVEDKYEGIDKQRTSSEIGTIAIAGEDGFY